MTGSAPRAPTPDTMSGVRVIPPCRPVNDLAADARAGLLHRPRQLPPKYFYDASGSALFDAICDTPEYYLTRTEHALLERCAAGLMQQAAADAVIELGAGTARKTRTLLAHARPGTRYRPFDICAPLMQQVGRDLGREFPHLRIEPCCGDYHAGLAHLEHPPGRCLFLFLGSTLGNFEDDEASTFLDELTGQMAPGDCLLLGVDRVKSRQRLEAAYNDAQGLTARFNLNLLEVLNRELLADFDPAAFRHHAFYNASAHRIEMHLHCLRACRVQLRALGETIHLAQGESIRTEISRKFTRSEAELLLQQAGLEILAHEEAPNGDFSLLLGRLPQRHHAVT